MGPVLLHAMKGATVDHKLSVLVQMDLDNRSVRLAVTGCLTEANQHVLYPFVRRARTLVPPVTVIVDLTAAGHVEAPAVDLLHWAIDHDQTLDGAGPVDVLLPSRLPEHRPAPARSPRLPTPRWRAA